MYVFGIALSELSIAAFTPGVDLALWNGAHVTWSAIYSTDIGDIFDQNGGKGVVESVTAAECSMHVTSHGVDVSIDGEEGGMMCTAWKLFDEGGEGEVFGSWEGLVVVFLADSSLSIFICT